MISQIDAALADILRKELVDILPKPWQTGAYLPHEKGEIVLGLHLYSIRSCTEVNASALAASGRNIKAIPPRFLTLNYLMTAYSSAALPYRAQEDHRILTRAMEAFEKNPTLTEAVLGFKPGIWVEELKLQFDDLDATEISRAWEHQNAPYRLSAAYKVFPVELSVLNGRIAPRINETKPGVSGMEDKDNA